jgi:hypothetical protein
MSLSEEEQRILELLDASLQNTHRNLDPGRSSHRTQPLVLAGHAITITISIGLLFFSLASNLVAFGVLGFVLLVASINHGVNAWSATPRSRM